MSSCRFIVGDTRAVVASIPDGSIDLVLTSPPFLALRSYLPADHPDKHLEIGQEPNPAAFLDTLLELTAEWGRVLAPHGSIAVELGDTYSGIGGTSSVPNPAYGDTDRAQAHKAGDMLGAGRGHRKAKDLKHWPLAKSLALIPELYRVGLAYGVNPLTGAPSPAGRWRVRNVVRWCRPNPPVGALGDKYRPSTSEMVVACRSDRRWFDLDAVRTASVNPIGVGVRPTQARTSGSDDMDHRSTLGPFTAEMQAAGAPPLDHWIIPTAPYKGAHYATFPPALCTIPIESMCPREVCTVCGEPRRRIVETANALSNLAERHDEATRRANADETNAWRAATGATFTQNVTLGWTDCGHGSFRPGVVLDPFGGSGTVGQVATGHGRDAILVDLDERNAHLAVERIGMFCAVEFGDFCTVQIRETTS